MVKDQALDHWKDFGYHEIRMKTELLAISNFDLVKFGCPYCGSMDGHEFISNGTCSIWNCDHCQNDSVIVGNSVKEVQQFTIRNTDIKDLIGHHPFEDADGCTINSFSAKLNHLPLC